MLHGNTTNPASSLHQQVSLVTHVFPQGMVLELIEPVIVGMKMDDPGAAPKGLRTAHRLPVTDSHLH